MKDKEQKSIFEEWLARYKALIFKIVRAYASDDMDRDDLFQETAIQLWHSIPSFRQQSAATTWIYRVSLNTAIKWVRKQRKYPPGNSLDDAEHLLQDTGHMDQRLEWLYDEINKLNEIDRSVALLLLDDFSYREIAAILGITESNVGVKINRIKKHLVTKLKNYA